jgi:hypothetical protein
LVDAKSWLPRPRAWCAIGSRGVSLRRFSVPEGGGQEFFQRLQLQVEAEFPLAPEALAWGWQPVGQSAAVSGGAHRQEVVVVAVKRELVADYDEILRACGTDPVITLAAVARWNFCGQPADTVDLLDVGERQAELTLFEKGVPARSRVFFRDGASPGVSAVALGQQVRGGQGANRLVLTGGVTKEFSSRLAVALEPGCRCEPVDFPPGRGASAAICGLEALAAAGRAPALTLALAAAPGGAARWNAGEWRKWSARIGGLLLALLFVPCLEALFLKPHLTHKVDAFTAESARLDVIDRELDFLRDLKLSQPPYLDVVSLFTKSVPPGTRIDSLSLNSRGEMSLRCAFHDGQQVADFRKKLIGSGFFTNVVVEEQAPTLDHQKVNVRISGLEMPAAQLQVAAARLEADDAAEEKKAGAPGHASPPVGPASSPAGPTTPPASPAIPGKEPK